MACRRGAAELPLATIARVTLAAIARARSARFYIPAATEHRACALLNRAHLMSAGRSGTMAAAELATANAWARRLSGEPEIDAWRTAHSAWRTAGYHYPALVATEQLTGALLAAGDRDAARESLFDAWVIARSMGAEGVIERLLALAKKARIHLDDARTHPAGPIDRLTPREREVLDLLAAGASNRAISPALFISQKTASVHVSNLMAKLGVSNRLEAAALAHQTS